MDASQTVPAAESSAPLLHQILPTLVPYTPDRFNDMYSVWAGEILLPVGSFVSEPEDDERAILRNKFAAVVGSVTQEPVEAFWLTVNFWLLVQRHLSEAERLHQPSLVRKKGRGEKKNNGKRASQFVHLVSCLCFCRMVGQTAAAGQKSDANPGNGSHFVGLHCAVQRDESVLHRSTQPVGEDVTRSVTG